MRSWAEPAPFDTANPDVHTQSNANQPARITEDPDTVPPAVVMLTLHTAYPALGLSWERRTRTGACML